MPHHPKATNVNARVPAQERARAVDRLLPFGQDAREDLPDVRDLVGELELARDAGRRAFSAMRVRRRAAPRRGSLGSERRQPARSACSGAASGVRGSSAEPEIEAREVQDELAVQPSGRRGSCPSKRRRFHVDPGREADGGARQGLSEVAECHQRRDREAAAGRVAGDREVRRGDAVRAQPAARRDRVVDCGRVRMLRRQPIVDREDARAGRAGRAARRDRGAC
jgi:hypothetical protein